MHTDLFTELNSVYKPLCEKVSQIKNKLIDAGFSAAQGFYNNHYVRRGDGFEAEHFPIPVISVADMGDIDHRYIDIGVDVDSIWIELKLSKAKAMEMDYPSLSRAYRMEVYGAEDYLNDFCNAQTDPRDAAQKLEASGETEICILIYLDISCDLDEPVQLVKLFST